MGNKRNSFRGILINLDNSHIKWEDSKLKMFIENNKIHQYNDEMPDISKYIIKINIADNDFFRLYQEIIENYSYRILYGLEENTNRKNFWITRDNSIEKIKEYEEFIKTNLEKIIKDEVLSETNAIEHLLSILKIEIVDILDPEWGNSEIFYILILKTGDQIIYINQ